MWFSDSVHQSLDFQTTMIHCTSTTPPNKAVRLPHSQQKSKSTTTKLATMGINLSANNLVYVFTLHKSKQVSLSLLLLYKLLNLDKKKKLSKYHQRSFNWFCFVCFLTLKIKARVWMGKKSTLSSQNYAVTNIENFSESWRGWWVVFYMWNENLVSFLNKGCKNMQGKNSHQRTKTP